MGAPPSRCSLARLPFSGTTVMGLPADGPDAGHTGTAGVTIIMIIMMMTTVMGHGRGGGLLADGPDTGHETIEVKQ